MPKEWKKNKKDLSAPTDFTEPFGAELLSAELNQDAPQVDLHGLREEEAEAEVERFLNAQFVAGSRFGRVIHGKGQGSLRQVTHRLLALYAKKGIIAAYRDSTYALGGATVFALHPNE